jgi:hypothetical protein
MCHQMLSSGEISQSDAGRSSEMIIDKRSGMHYGLVVHGSSAASDGRTVLPTQKDKAMDAGKDWWVTLEHEDALLFALAPDGTMKMRVVPITEWEAQLAENEALGASRAVADVVRHIVSADDASGAPLAGMPSAAAK